MTSTTDKLTDSNLDDILNDSMNRNKASDVIVAYWVSKGECFSSGEVSAAIREHLPNLQFSVLSVGAHLRESFYAQTMPGYDDGMGGTEQPVQVSRVTEGLYPDRTLPGSRCSCTGRTSTPAIPTSSRCTSPVRGRGRA